MNGEAKRALQFWQQISSPQVGLLATALLDVQQDLPRQLVAVLRPTPLGQQSNSPPGIDPPIYPIRDGCDRICLKTAT